MKNILKVVFVIIGTLIGAGFASGQEINTFFFSSLCRLFKYFCKKCPPIKIGKPYKSPASKLLKKRYRFWTEKNSVTEYA